MAGEIAKWFVALGVQGEDRVRSALTGVKRDLGDLTNFASVLKGGLATLGSTLAVYTTYHFAEAGARALELRDAFREVSRQAGESGDALLDALRRASGGTIAETDLMLSVNRAFMLGLGASMRDLVGLMEVARFRARAMGLDTTQAFSDIITGLGRMSPLILDNLGLVFDADEEYKRYAQALGKAADELTALEKRQALLQATLRVGKDQIAAAGGVARSSADDFREVAAALDDVKLAFQEMAAETGVAGVLADAARGLAENVRAGREATRTYQAFLAEVDRLTASHALTAREAQWLRDQYALLQTELAYGTISQAQYTAGVQALQQALADGTVSQARYTAAVQALQQALADTGGTLGKAWGAYQAFLAEVDRLAAAHALTAQEAQRFRDQHALLQTGLAYGTISQAQYTAGVQALQQALADTGEAFETALGGARAWQGFLDAMPPRLARAEAAQATFAQMMRGAFRWTDLAKEQGPVSPMWARILNKMWTDTAEQARKAAEEARLAWERTLEGIQTTLGGIMRPTFTFDYATIMDELGHHLETWDEEARRAMDVVTRGLESPWAQRMLDLGMITQADVEAHAGDIRAAAATWIKEFYEGLHPEAIQAEPVAKLWRDQVTSEAQWKGIFGELSQVLGKQLEADRGRMEAAGTAAGRIVAQGIKKALAESDFLTYLVDLIVPRLPSHATHAAIRGGYVE